MAKKVTVVIPNDVFEKLQKVSNPKEITMSAAVCKSISLLDWFCDAENNNFKICTRKDDKYSDVHLL